MDAWSLRATIPDVRGDTPPRIGAALHSTEQVVSRASDHSILVSSPEARTVLTLFCPQGDELAELSPPKSLSDLTHPLLDLKRLEKQYYRTSLHLFLDGLANTPLVHQIV